MGERLKSNYIWNREELGVGEQAVTKGMSTGDLLVPKIEQGRSGWLEKFCEAEPSACGRQVPSQPATPLQRCLMGRGKTSWQVSAQLLTDTVASSTDPAVSSLQRGASPTTLLPAPKPSPVLTYRSSAEVTSWGKPRGTCCVLSNPITL